MNDHQSLASCHSLPYKKRCHSCHNIPTITLSPSLYNQHSEAPTQIQTTDPMDHIIDTLTVALSPNEDVEHEILVKPSPDASGYFMPSRFTLGSAGDDLWIRETVLLPPTSTIKANLGFSMKMPDGFYGEIIERSSMALQNISIRGLIDNDYRGDIHLIIQNHSTASIPLYRGSRVAQFLLRKQYRTKWKTTSTDVPWDETIRGTRGFGSTGI
jgi:dUTP diphosphatase